MAKQRVCEYCKAKLTGEEKVCPNCGAPVKPAITPIPRDPQQSVPTSKPRKNFSALIVVIVVLVLAVVFSLVGLCSR